MKKAFLIALIGALSISALMGVFIMLFGRFGEIEGKILVTTLNVGFFSIMGLVSFSLFKQKFISQLGVFFAIFFFLWSVLLTWEVTKLINDSVKMSLSLIVVVGALFHSSLMLLTKPDKKPVQIALYSTIALTVIISLMLLYLILIEFHIDREMFFRVLGAFAILDAFGTILTPILKKIVK